MSAETDLAIVGAGPYGLAIAAHLRAQRIAFRIFGRPLHSWRAQMPKDMFLKSEGFASDLYDPEGEFTLKRFCMERGLEYADDNWPVPLETFTAYGVAFQQRLVPEVEERAVVEVQWTGQGFRIELDDGEIVTARRVVIAVGLSDFRQVPAELAALPEHVFSHAADHRDLDKFKGRDVAVIGGGSSAFDIVASLRKSGATARLVARRTQLKWNMPVEKRQWGWTPSSGLGGGWRNCFFERAPMVFRCLPQDARLQIVRRWLGPAGGWPSRKYVEQSPLFLGQQLRGAEYDGAKVTLHLSNHSGIRSTLTTDHVIAATGYKVDLRRAEFLSDEIKANVRCADHTPVLSQNFESSVPDLYFVGLASANTFGPVMRFLLGARHTARRITRHVA
jgi:lysine/ornithine N-monooxygenase